LFAELIVADLLERLNNSGLRQSIATGQLVAIASRRTILRVTVGGSGNFQNQYVNNKLIVHDLEIFIHKL
jgi:hypothetical protein